MTQICNPVGEQCFNCEDYTEAFACLDKTKISQMPELSELELDTLLDSECDDIRIPAAVVPCNGTPYNIAVSLKDLGKGGGGSPLVSTFWTPLDLGDTYLGCWLKFNETQILTRTEYPDFFEAANIVGDSYTLEGMKGKFPMGAGTGYCNAGQIIGNQNSSITLGCQNLPACQIQINDPGHKHRVRFPKNEDHDKGCCRDSYTSPPWEEEEFIDLPVDQSFTGITATHKVGQGGNGNPVAIDVKPWSICGYWYIKVSNDCD